MRWVMLCLGLLVVLGASALLLAGRIQAGTAAAIGTIGIGLIAVSTRWKRKDQGKSAPVEQIEQTVYAPDRQTRALVKRSGDGSYRVEVQRFIHEDLPEVGPYDRWERQPGILVTGTLANAIELAARSVGAGTEDFFDAAL